jgi:ribonuclease HII
VTSEQWKAAAEAEKAERMLRYERELWAKGLRTIAGVDEAGRGPLAGPVVAAAVIVEPGFYIPGVDDSKKLTPATRNALFEDIMRGSVSVGVGIVDHETIDRVNILNATLEAMGIAVASLKKRPEFLLIDGNRFRGGGIPFSTIVDGDALCFSVAAASIIAKVTRDRIMVEYDTEYPQYGFARHKGYGTRQHRSAILEHGVCPIHRKSFARRTLQQQPLPCASQPRIPAKKENV